MKGASLRRQQRHSHQPSVAQGSDAPVSLVFRTHSDALSKAAFLFCPKNFNLANPSSASTAGATAAGAATRAPPLAATSPHEGRRLATALVAAAAAAARARASSTESVQSLVEAIVELRPCFVPAPLHPTHTSGGGGNGTGHAPLPPGSPLTSSTGEGTTASFRGLPGRSQSNVSVNHNSYVDLMVQSSFMSPTSTGSFAGANSSTTSGHATVSPAGLSRNGDASPRMCSSPSTGGFPSSPRHAGAGPSSNGIGGVPSHHVGATQPGGGGAGSAGSGSVPTGGATSSGGSATAASGGAAAAAGSSGAGAAGSSTGGGGASSLMHPSGGWICRAMAFNDKEVSHANGAISVNQSLTSKCALINEVAKGKIMARILSSYQEVQERYGLSHVEVTVDNQYLSRSDMFLISEALRERILYEGEETHLCGFRIRVREMLQAVAHTASSGSAAAAAAMPVPQPTTASGVGGVAGAGPGTAGAGSLNHAGPGGPTPASYVRVGCGVVLPTTRINFQSLSPVHYVLLELSREMWETTMDGRIALTLAIRKFLSELLLKQLPKRKASPLVRVVFTGRLQKEFQFGRHSDVFHLLELPRELRSSVDIVEEVRMHCEALVDRVLREVRACAWQQLEAEVRAYRESTFSVGATPVGVRGTGDDDAAAADASFDAYVRARQQYIAGLSAKRLFVNAKQSNTLEALSILLERSTHHYMDRHLTLCGHAVTILSAGKGLYQVTNSLVQIVCARLHDMGLEKVHVVCVGRPPLHVTPLLEYTSDDDTLRSQYHLHSRVLSGARAGRGSGGRSAATAAGDAGEVELYYETPEWIAVFFFHASLSNTSGGETVFQLLPKECWQREHPVMAALKSLWPTTHAAPTGLPTASAFSQTDRSYQPRTLRGSPGGGSAGARGDGGDGGEEDGSGGVGGAEAHSSTGGGAHMRAAAAAAVAAAAAAAAVVAEPALASAATASPPLLIPGLGLRTYPVPEVTLPVHPHGAMALRCMEGWGYSANGGVAVPSPALPGVADAGALISSAGAAASVSTPGGTGAAPSVSRRPLPLHPPAAPPEATAGVASRLLSPTSPLYTAGALPVARSSPLLVRATTASSSAFASPTTATHSSMPSGGGGVGGLAGWRDAAGLHGLHRAPTAATGVLPRTTAPASATGPPATSVRAQTPPLSRHVSPAHALSGSSPTTTAGIAAGGIWGSEVAPRSSIVQLRRGGHNSFSAGGGSGGAPSHTSMMAVVASASGGGRLSHPNSLPTYYATGGQPALHISRSFDYKTTAHPEYHSLGAFEQSVRSSAGSSSLLGRRHTPARLHARANPWRDGSSVARSSSTSIVTSVAATAAAAGTGPGVGGSTTSAFAPMMPTGTTGLRAVQLRLEDGHVYRDVMGGSAVPYATCTWYCLHAAKPHHDCGVAVGGATAGVGSAAAAASGGGTVPGGAAPAASATAAGGGPSSTGAGSSPSGALLLGRGHASLRDAGPQGAVGESALGSGAAASATVAASAVAGSASAPQLNSGDGAAAEPVTRRWHKPSSSTRADAVSCGCNVVDSDLRNGYLILEVTISAAVLPCAFWSPRLLLDDQHWALLMSCFTGRDDRLTLDEALEFVSEEDDDEDANDEVLTVDSSASLAHGLDDGSSSSGVLGRRKEGGGSPRTSPPPLFTEATTAAPTGSGPAAGEPAVSSSGGGGAATGEAYHFQSDFRSAEVFCRSHSGITADGRTLVLPTHNNGVYFQSSEEILLRFLPQLFVGSVDEGGEQALELRGPDTPASPFHNTHRHRRQHGPPGFGGASEEASGSHSLRSAEGAASRQTSSIHDAGELPLPTGALAVGDHHRRVSADAIKTAPPTTTEEARAVGSGGDWDGAGRSAVPAVASSSPASGPVDAATALPSSAGRSSTTGRSGSSGARSGGGSPLLPRGRRGRGSPAAAAVAATSLPTPASALGGGEADAMGAVEEGSGAEQPAPSGSVHLVPAPAPPPPTTSLTAMAGAGDGAAHAPTTASTTDPAAAAAASQMQVGGCAGEEVQHHDDVPLMPGTTVTVGFVQLRNSLLFAIKPVNPLRPGVEEEQREEVTVLAQSAESVSTATVLRRRWQWKHPDIAAEPPHLASWTRLCTCRLLPVYGSKPAYPREGFYTVSPHQYTVASPTDPAEERRRLLEFVLQRLQQQYQIVVDSPGLAAGSQWPRADPSPNARLELSLGHQTHTLKVGETAKTISVTRMLHRGMYSNGQVTHMLSYRYLLWNYLADEFTTREVHMEAQVGERNAFPWESLDRWLQDRPEAYIPRGPDLWLRSREVAVVLLPEDAAHPPSYEEFFRFIGYRFSIHLSTHGKVVWKPHDSGVSLDVSPTTPSVFPPAPPLMEVVLVHDNPLTLDTRNVVDRVTGRTMGFEVPVQERFMSVDVSLPQQYDAHCCYFLKVSWLVCAASIVVDWLGSFIANASRFRFHAVPIGCYYSSPKAESLTAHYDVVAPTPEEEPALRRTLIELLMTRTYHYYADTPVITRNCRLVHFSGLCCVIVPPSATVVAQWYQNAFVRQGSVEQLALLAEFREAVDEARRRVAEAALASAAAASTAAPGVSLSGR